MRFIKNEVKVFYFLLSILNACRLNGQRKVQEKSSLIIFLRGKLEIQVSLYSINFFYSQETWIEIYSGPEKEFTDRKLEGNNTYYYRVLACNEKGKADPSDTSSVVISTLPTPSSMHKNYVTFLAKTSKPPQQQKPQNVTPQAPLPGT